MNPVEHFPRGYPQLSAFADSDDNFMIYRRFGYIHARLLLHFQDELRELEKKLYDMDLRDGIGSEKSRACLQSREIDEERDLDASQGSRGELLEKIEHKALQYGTSSVCISRW